ncbi:ABC transporter permease subunit [Motilimonas pumila]|uniref:ABC transporter permease subunit n=1 Tax=Motilimonas pumila TaxID=2303987 RepID=A0A418YJY3_9GAMM|nr:ABC transporter permease subunit [Motilimonas pumila]RJG51291.1 ABC transporter permease subunit [Motilimonas pumila]
MAEEFSLSLAGSRKRLVKDKLAKYGVTTGAVLVLTALLLIFFYLLYVVQPIFEKAEIEKLVDVKLSQQANSLALGMEEQNEIAYRMSDNGLIEFIAIKGKQQGQVIKQHQLSGQVTSFAQTVPAKGMMAFGFADGSLEVVMPNFLVSYPNDIRQITPELRFPLGEERLEIDPQGQPLSHIAFELSDESAGIAAITKDGRALFMSLTGEEDMMTEEVVWEGEVTSLPDAPAKVDQLILLPNLRNLYVRSGNRLSIYDISDIDDVQLKGIKDISANQANVTRVELLTGASSLLVANDNGVISQWFEVASNGTRELTHIREFKAEGSVVDIAPEFFRKGFLTIDSNGYLDIFHTTGETQLLSEKISANALQSVAISPRANALLIETNGTLSVYRLENEHPEVTWSALWQEVWYEGYAEPDYVWQSTSASDDFEPKLSLVPISFGTIKAAMYAMLFAVPIALAGAIYTAYFMSSGVRKFVKPTVEIMEALPTVILGFLAGLWLAPLIEENMPGIVLLIVTLPLSMLLAAFVWHNLPKSVRQATPEGWHSLILIPIVIAVGYGAIAVSPTFEVWLFDGDARKYMTNELGINFDQRNSLVVGIAMGFAVIPTIFSIAEDAVFSVPKHLTNGSLALGATNWQTLVRVVILTASPGIFSAVMMGLGRAVGETMIVLMATGNTPVMDWSVFQGMRTLAANIAVEMPESEVGSSHYRVLFLAAFVLFVFTFCFNTVAEFVRQRLREKYSSL